MKIGVLEHFQAITDSPKHFVTGGKARRLVEELRVAAKLSRDRIQITVAHAWSVVKMWLKTSRLERETAAEAADDQEQRVRQVQANILFPHGAQHGFSRWPSPDQRTVGV